METKEQLRKRLEKEYLTEENIEREVKRLQGQTFGLSIEAWARISLELLAEIDADILWSLRNVYGTEPAVEAPIKEESIWEDV